MKTYFEYKGYKVVDYKDKTFANYKVEGYHSNRCFHELDEAILYCIAFGNGKLNDLEVCIHIETFLTMINKK